MASVHSKGGLVDGKKGERGDYGWKTRHGLGNRGQIAKELGNIGCKSRSPIGLDWLTAKTQTFLPSVIADSSEKARDGGSGKMREPKWTEEQTEQHKRWRLKNDNCARETKEDCDEFFFCRKYYANTPEGRRRSEEIHRMNRVIEKAAINQAYEVASDVYSRGEGTIIKTIQDPAQSQLLKELLVSSYILPRRCVEAVLNGDDGCLHWLVLGQPVIGIDDLLRVSVDPRYEAEIRRDAARRLQRHPKWQSSLVA
jgi:hypothetical protein